MHYVFVWNNQKIIINLLKIFLTYYISAWIIITNILYDMMVLHHNKVKEKDRNVWNKF